MAKAADSVLAVENNSASADVELLRTSPSATAVTNEQLSLPLPSLGTFHPLASRQPFWPPFLLNREERKEIWNTLILCRDKGREQLLEISREVAPRIPMKPESCYTYLQNIEHNLDGNHLQALQTFFQYLIRRGEAPENALPVKFFPDSMEMSKKSISK